MTIFCNPFHFVTVSPWPFLCSVGLILLFLGLFCWFILYQLTLLIIGIVTVTITCLQWWRDVIREREFQGFHVVLVIKLIRYRFLIFIISEIFFFVSFFWSYFHFILNPPVECGVCWPPLGIIAFDAYGIPIINSFILITSGITITLSHHLILLNKQYKFYLLITIFFGVLFTLFQFLEYYYSSFTIADSVYGSLFFIITGFHGLHVIVGSLFLIYCLYRTCCGHFISFHHVGFEIASWYWHFVDVIWLFLYIVVYWW